MHPHTQHLLGVTRRQFLRNCQVGLGALALSQLAGRAEEVRLDPTNPLAPRPPHYRAKAKNVIYLHMAGSPPHLDMFDYKPELVRRNGQDCPQEFLRGRRFAFTSGPSSSRCTPSSSTTPLPSYSSSPARRSSAGRRWAPG